jgi:hypothetical protein
VGDLFYLAVALGFLALTAVSAWLLEQLRTRP